MNPTLHERKTPVADVNITTEDVRGAVVLAMEGFWHPDAGADFDRWLAEHDREKDAEILRLRKIIHRARSLNDRQSNSADQWEDMDRILREVEASADTHPALTDEQAS